MRVILIILFISIIPIKSNASISIIEQIYHRNLFCPVNDTTFTYATQKIILDKIDSIKVSLKGLNLAENSKIDGVTSFSRLDCVSLITISDGSMFIIGYYIDNYQIALFNSYDSSIYTLGGDIKSFSKVVKQSLSNFQDSTKVLGLIELYLNTLYFYDPRIILVSYIDFANTYSDERLLLPNDGEFILYSFKEAEADKRKVKKALRNLEYISEDDSCSVKLCSWSLASGELVSCV